jgi:streptomycin 6-kinase
VSIFEIPEILKKKVYRAFGEDGLRWLDRLPALHAACARRWRLRDCRVSGVISFNYVGFAESPDYGPVALKIGVPQPELYTEMRALQLYEGNHICRCYEHDTELGAMLLERILPGRDLTTVADRSERTEIAARLITGLPLPCSNEPGLPAFGDWIRRAFARVRREGKASEGFLQLVQTAEELHNELQHDGRPPHLLHGDLNHWNMLYDAAGDDWKAIDPKGAIGPRCLEAGRFILNEMEFAGAPASPGDVASMAEAVGAAAGEPAHLMARCAFLDSVLSTCWTLEEHVSRDMSAAEDRCRALLEVYQALSYARR